MHVRDIPVLGDVIDSAIVYVTTLARIVRHPFGFVYTLAFDDTQVLKRAFKFIGAAIALAYLIIAPALTRHDFDVGELRFGVVVLLRLALVTVLYHAAFLIVGYRQPIAKSLILSSYLNGVYFPLFMAAMLPGLLVFGPRSFFEPVGGEFTPPADASALELALAVSGYLLVIVVYPFFFAVAAYWWAKAFTAKTWLSAVLPVFAIVLAGIGNLYILPFVTRLFL